VLVLAETTKSKFVPFANIAPLELISLPYIIPLALMFPLEVIALP
jgi:hypothetical protein